MSAALVIALALQAAAPPDDAQLAEMHRAYEQSCIQRDYGAFDDICNQLADQIAAYERRSAAASARPAPGRRTAATPVAVPSPPPAAPPSPAAPPPPGTQAPP